MSESYPLSTKLFLKRLSDIYPYSQLKPSNTHRILRVLIPWTEIKKFFDGVSEFKPVDARVGETAYEMTWQEQLSRMIDQDVEVSIQHSEQRPAYEVMFHLPPGFEPKLGRGYWPPEWRAYEEQQA